MSALLWIVCETITWKFQIVGQTEQPANKRGNPRYEHALIGGGNQGSSEEKMVRRSLGQLSETVGEQFIGRWFGVQRPSIFTVQGKK